MQNSVKTDFKSYGSDSWVILSEIEKSIKEKIEKVGVPLKDWDINIYRGVLTGYNEAFIINGQKKEEILNNCKTEEERLKTIELIRPILRGRDIKRYSYEFADLYLLFIPWHFPLHNDTSIVGASEKAEQEFKNQYPAVYSHLLKYKDQLSNRNKAETGIHYEWYALQRWGANYWEDFYRHKIIYPETTQGAYFAYDKNSNFIDKTAFILISKDPLFLLSILSSKLFSYSYKKIFSSIELGESAYQYNKHALEKLPIAKLKQEEQVPFLRLMNEILNSKNNGVNADTISLEKELDTLIYNLYNITEEEVNFIESQ